MLLINQRLDKLAAMRTDFVERGMLPGRHHANSTPQGPERLGIPTDGDDDDDNDKGPVDEDILGHVRLARNRGMPYVQSYWTSF